jgi:hypothetical protein
VATTRENHAREPGATTEWATFTASRQEAARRWNDLLVRQRRVRRLQWTWPSTARGQRWAKGRYPGRSAPSAQQLIGEGGEAVDSRRQLRRNGQAEARYPWNVRRDRAVVYTNQDARIRDRRLILPQDDTPGRPNLPDGNVLRRRGVP